MVERFSRGSTARLPLDLIVDGVGADGESPIIAIQRVDDDKWFQASDDTWHDHIVNNPMTELDAVDLPGRYYFDFDQTLDDLEESYSYLAKLANAGTPAALEYRDLEFRPLSNATAPDLCAVTGTVYTAQGVPCPNQLVQATMVPVFTSQGRGIRAEVVATYTDVLGDFSLDLVQGAVVRLQIETIGYDRKVTIPDQATVVFTDL